MQGTAPAELASYPGAPYEATNGDLWFSTVLTGLVRYDGEAFTTFTTEDGLAGNTIRGLFEDGEGVLWIATTGGVSRYDGEVFTTLGAYADLEPTHFFSEQGDQYDLWDLHFDRSGVLWITTTDGVFKHDGTVFVPFPLPVVAGPGLYEFGPKMVYSIFEALDGALWFATDGAGAVRYDGDDWSVYTVKDHGLASDRVCTIFADSRGDFWFGTSDGGVSRYDGSKFTTHMRNATRSPHSGWGRCMAIHEDRGGNVWLGVASAGGGVHRFDGEDFRYFSVEDGLGTGGVPSIREDRSGNLWFGTTGGVYRFDGERFSLFTKES